MWNVVHDRHIPNGAVLAIMFAVIVFLVGLVSEQISALRASQRGLTPDCTGACCAIAVGVALRLAFGLVYWTGKPLTHDEREYLALATNVAHGRGFTAELPGEPAPAERSSSGSDARRAIRSFLAPLTWLDADLRAGRLPASVPDRREDRAGAPRRRRHRAARRDRRPRRRPAGRRPPRRGSRRSSRRSSGCRPTR